MNADVLILAHLAENQKLGPQPLIMPKTRLMIPPDINAERVGQVWCQDLPLCIAGVPWHLATLAERPILPCTCSLKALVPRVGVTCPELKASPSKSLCEALVAVGNRTLAYLSWHAFSNKFAPAGRFVCFCQPTLICILITKMYYI